MREHEQSLMTKCQAAQQHADALQTLTADYELRAREHQEALQAAVAEVQAAERELQRVPRLLKDERRRQVRMLRTHAQQCLLQLQEGVEEEKRRKDKMESLRRALLSTLREW